MALTKIITDGITDDAVTSGKIPANAVGTSEIANDAVTSTQIADNTIVAGDIADATITLAKLEHGTGSNDGKFLRANNGADPTFETVTGTTINNNADNRVITGSGTANTLNGEANLIFDGLNLGIRTTPSQPLHINQAGSSTTMRIENANADFLIQAGSAGAGGLHLYDMDNSAYRAVLTNTGNLGINTTSPSHKLHVESATSGVIAAKQTTNNGGFNTFEGKSSGGSVTFYASHNGRVGATEGVIFGSDTAAANVLDDYEEGTFTPTNTIGLTLTNNTTAHYTKIGRVVHIQIDCTFSGSADSSQCGIIQGLPFTSKSGCVNEGSLQFISNTSNAKFNYDEDNTRIFIGASESRIDIQNITGGTFQTRAFMVGRRFRIQMHYLTA